MTRTSGHDRSPPPTLTAGCRLGTVNAWTRGHGYSSAGRRRPRRDRAGQPRPLGAQRATVTATGGTVVGAPVRRGLVTRGTGAEADRQLHQRRGGPTDRGGDQEHVRRELQQEHPL